MDWLFNVLISAVVSSIISASLVSILSEKIKLSFDLQNNSIKHIHSKGQAVKSFEKKLRSKACKEVKVLGFSAQGFTHSYRSELVNFVASGGHLQYLLCKPEGTFIRQAAEMEGRSPTAILDSVVASIEIIRLIYDEAKERAQRNQRTCGTIEVRYYETEIRNQLLLCVDNENNYYAWLSILLPPLAAVNCQMIEYSDATECVNYFNTIWKRHEKDVVSL
ncbi:MAG: hypothetical protein K5990_04805 [Oscillospiraceae bacterium]|nr:hypothetical protein [Oscillospiraceae bacterium]